MHNEIQAENMTDQTKHTGFGWRWFKELVILLIVLVVVVTAVDYYRLQQRESQLVSVAELSVLIAQFTPAQQQRFTQGKPLLVYVWATWCGVCKLTSRAVSNLVESGALVSTVALKSGPDSEVKKYLAEHDYSFSTYSDNKGELTEALSVKGTPTFFILNYLGEIKYYSMGVNTEIGLRAKLALFSQK